MGLDAEESVVIAERLGHIRLSQEFGWTLEYCETLDPFVKAEIYGFLDAQKKLLKKGSQH